MSEILKVLQGAVSPVLKPVLKLFFDTVVIPLIAKAEGSVPGVPGVVLAKVTADIDTAIDVWLS